MLRSDSAAVGELEKRFAIDFEMLQVDTMFFLC
jgi:hypothetical protein